MGKCKIVQPNPKLPRNPKKGKNKKPLFPWKCPKRLEHQELPTGKKCLRLQMPGIQVGTDRVPGPPGLFSPSSSAETLSAEDIQLGPSRFPASSSTDESTPPRPPRQDRYVSYQDPVEEFINDASDERDPESSDFQGDASDGLEVQDSELDDDDDGSEEEDALANKFTEYDRVTNQILARLEQNEQKARDLEKALSDRDTLLAQHMAKAGAPRQEDSPRQPVTLPRFVLAARGDYTFPSPTRVTDFPNKQSRKRPAPPATDTRAATQPLPQAMAQCPIAPQAERDAQQGGYPLMEASQAYRRPGEGMRVWDAWDMRERARYNSSQGRQPPPYSKMPPSNRKWRNLVFSGQTPS